MATFFSVNIGHFPTYNEATDFRKRHLKNTNLPIVSIPAGFTIRLSTTLHEKSADEAVENLSRKYDAWKSTQAVD